MEAIVGVLFVISFTLMADDAIELKENKDINLNEQICTTKPESYNDGLKYLILS
jgi:hypothetical protein